MPEEKFTRCPSCRTVFRVTQAQLEMRSGQVRCGHCQTVFDGVAHLVSLAPPAEDDDAEAFDEAAMGPPTVTLRSARALGVAPGRADVSDSAGAAPAAHPVASPAIEAGVAAAATAVHAPRPDTAGPPPDASLSATARDERRDSNAADAPADAAAPPRRRRTALLWGLGSVTLLLLLAAQAVFHFRDGIAARWPATAPALTQACAVAGCTVGPPHDIAEIAIQSSDLQADPAHRGLLILTANLRNRSARMLAYPHLELTLTDAQDQVVVRRAFAPPEYVGGTADLAAGIPANADVAVKLFIDASATTQAGYRLYLFYL